MWERNWDTTALRGIGDQDSMAWRPEVEKSVTVNAWILANLHIEWTALSAWWLKTLRSWPQNRYIKIQLSRHSYRCYVFIIHELQGNFFI